ncbi:uncharacterized protein V1518DRAFT_242984 [Limtongia smithiae]|uniref:uncharacterized protein n=1 Tax=Limtongia smithiae TaxID=1125753 RepID=UPI0034CFDEDE
MSSDDDKDTDKSTADILARLNAFNAPSHVPGERSPSPDALGDLDMLTARFEKIVGRSPAGGSSSSRINTAQEESDSIDPHIFLAQFHDDEERLQEDTRWKTPGNLPEVDDEDFERMLKELSMKEWELTPDELEELAVLESIPAVHTTDKHTDGGPNKYLSDDYLKAMLDDVDSQTAVSATTTAKGDSAENDKAVVSSEKDLLKEGAHALIDAQDLIASEKTFEKTFAKTSEKAGLYDDDSDEFNEKTAPSTSQTAADSANETLSSEILNEKLGLSKEDTERFNVEAKDIEEQADRMVKMYAAMPNSGIAPNEKTDSDDEEELNEEQEADRLVDMYAQLGSDDEGHSEDEAKRTPSPEEANLFSRLEALKGPPKSLPALDKFEVATAGISPPTPKVVNVPFDPSPPVGKLNEDINLGCCLCSNDVNYRCLDCERQDEDNYLYCERCFTLTHLASDSGFEERQHRYLKL